MLDKRVKEHREFESALENLADEVTLANTNEMLKVLSKIQTKYPDHFIYYYNMYGAVIDEHYER